MSRRRRQRSAFTLLELLAATAMTAVLAGSLYATLHTAFRARRTAVAAVERVLKSELAVDLVRGDIESAVVPKGILAGAFLGEDGVGKTGRPSDALMLHCTADGAAQADGVGDIRMVTFACEDDAEGAGKVLVRRVTRNLLATKVEEPPAEVLCRGVRSFDLLYFDGMDWQGSWDSAAQENTLLVAVEVTLEMMPDDAADADQEGKRVSRVFRVACGSPAAGRRSGTGP